MTRKIVKTIFADGKRVSNIEETYTESDDTIEYGRLNIEYGNVIKRIEEGEIAEYLFVEKKRFEEMLAIYQVFMDGWKNETGVKK
ncbi:MAG: hypothetical protein FWF15_11375 [Oscillospiraceae bacterium]|nr:hypothetical protein [Oscillospiraceae bacterium]